MHQLISLIMRQSTMSLKVRLLNFRATLISTSNFLCILKAKYEYGNEKRPCQQKPSESNLEPNILIDSHCCNFEAHGCISQRERGGGGRQPIILLNFIKNWMKMKKIGLIWGCASKILLFRSVTVSPSNFCAKGSTTQNKRIQ